MAAARPLANFHPKPFCGKQDDDFDAFVLQLRSSIAVNVIGPGDNSVHFLRLRLDGGALRFFEALDAAHRVDLDHAIAALRRRYVNPNRQMVNRITFQARKFKPDFESVEDYLGELKKLAELSFPEPERVPRVREAFINGMPLKMKKKLLAEPVVDLVHVLAELASKAFEINKVCPTSDFPLNEVNLEEQNDTAVAVSLPHMHETDITVSVRLLQEQFQALSARVDALCEFVEFEDFPPMNNIQEIDDMCWHCGEVGHFARDCRFLQDQRWDAADPYQ
jgi:hypothetical protein